MPATLISTKWVSGNLVIYDSSGDAIATIDGSSRKISFPSGSTMEVLGTPSLPAASITSAMLTSGAGVAALISAGLGGSEAIVKTDAATDTIIAAHATKDRACLVVVVVDETYLIGTGTLPTVAVGEDDTIEKAMAASVLTTQAAGVVLTYAFTNTSTKKIIATSTAAVGNSTGGCSVTVLALPTT